MSKSVLVTGGAGFIGSHLVSQLLDEGEQVTVIDNFNDFYDPALKRDNVKQHLKSGQYTLVEGDIRDNKLVDGLLAQTRFDEVIHLAAMAGVRPSVANPSLYFDVNLNGSLNLFTAMRDHKVPRLILASSSSVYGNNEKVPFAETDPVDNPISPYAATKKAGELMAYTFHHLYGIKTSCLRFFTVYGPRQRPEMAIHKFTDLILRGEELQIYAEGKSRRDYTYIDDIVGGIMATRQADHNYEIINLGRSDTVELLDLIKMLEERLGHKARLKMLPAQLGDVNQTYADGTRAERLLGYKPSVSIGEGLDRFVAWYLKERNYK